MSEQKEKLPFYVVILGKIEAIINNISIDESEENKLHEFSEILRNSVLSEKEISLITGTLKSFSNHLSENDEFQIAEYLRELDEDLSLELDEKTERISDDFDRIISITDNLENEIRKIILSKNELFNKNLELEKRNESLRTINEDLLREGLGKP